MQLQYIVYSIMLTSVFIYRNQITMLKNTEKYTTKLNNFFEPDRQKPQWNTRFHTQKLPGYSALKDNHCKDYFQQDKKSRNYVYTKSGHKISIKQNSLLQSTPKQQNKLVKRYLNNDYIQNNIEQIFQLEIEIAQQQLANIWRLQRIPFHHRENFIQCIIKLPKQRIIEEISQEIYTLEDNSNLIIRLEKLIQSRETCQESIRQLVMKLNILNKEKEFIDEIETYIDNMQKMLRHLQLITVLIVEYIMQWRNKFLQLVNHAYNANQSNQIRDKLYFLPFVYNQKNYLLTIQKDLNYIQKYEFVKNLFQFKHNDPFLQDNEQIKQFSTNLAKRIQACQFIMKKESQYYHTNQKKMQMEKYCQQFLPIKDDIGVKVKEEMKKEEDQQTEHRVDTLDNPDD